MSTTMTKFRLHQEQEKDLRDYWMENVIHHHAQPAQSFEEWLNGLTPHEVLDAYLVWNGIQFWTSHIEAAVEAAFGVKLPMS